jgi:hypothetical protein
VDSDVALAPDMGTIAGSDNGFESAAIDGTAEENAAMTVTAPRIPLN